MSKMANWSKIKVSGKNFKEHSVPVNTKSISTPSGSHSSPDKKAPRLN